MNKREAQAIKTTVQTEGWQYIHKNLQQIYDKCSDDALKCETLAELRGLQAVRKFLKTFNGRIRQAIDKSREE